MIEITAKQREAYHYGLEWKTTIDETLALALRDMTAEVMRMEFEKEHPTESRGGWIWCYGCQYTHCPDLADGRMLRKLGDPRHAYQQADWQRAAHELLERRNVLSFTKLGGKSDD